MHAFKKILRSFLYFWFLNCKQQEQKREQVRLKE
jgi:hypothetical protein